MNIFLIMGFALLLSCKSKSPKPEVIDATSKFKTLSAEKMSVFKMKAINDGDTTAYNEVMVDYWMTNRQNEALYYAVIMANKHNYSKAAFDVYAVLTTGLDRDSLKKRLDKRTFDLAIEYLNKSSKGGDESAIGELERIRNAGLLSH